MNSYPIIISENSGTMTEQDLKTMIGIFIMMNFTGLIIYIVNSVKDRKINPIDWESDFWPMILLFIILIDCIIGLYWVGSLIGKLL